MILLCDVIVKYSFHRYSLCELLSAIDGKLCQHPGETGIRQSYTEIIGISEDYEKCNMFSRLLQMELYDNFMNATEAMVFGICDEIRNIVSYNENRLAFVRPA